VLVFRLVLPLPVKLMLGILLGMPRITFILLLVLLVIMPELLVLVLLLQLQLLI